MAKKDPSAPHDEASREKEFLNAIQRQLAEKEVSAKIIVAKQLSTATDELNAALAEAENVLAELDLGISWSMKIAAEPVFGTEEHLVFRKTDHGWRFTVDTFQIGVDDRPPIRSVPILNASRFVRLTAAAHMHKFVTDLVDTAKNQVDQVRSATASMRRLTDSLKNQARRS